MLYVSGIGRVSNCILSADYKKQNYTYDSLKKLHRCLKDNGIIQDSLKDFGRLDTVSKMTVAAVALALYDASFAGSNNEMGIIGTGSVGSLTSNVDFFKDYVDSGRKMCRGNLFVYTLPSAALAAAAIAFDLKGPLFFEMYGCSSFDKLFNNIETLMADQAYWRMIAVHVDANKVSAYLIEKFNIPTAAMLTVNDLLRREASCVSDATVVTV